MSDMELTDISSDFDIMDNSRYLLEEAERERVESCQSKLENSD